MPPSDHCTPTVHACLCGSVHAGGGTAASSASSSSSPSSPAVGESYVDGEEGAGSQQAVLEEETEMAQESGSPLPNLSAGAPHLSSSPSFLTLKKFQPTG
uniref:Uncharacterized protein n=1 Tax=Chromera velia CCMP2878 TaxID=1169474 RepID=A0A0G4HGP2_9ALVE|eukprot:Cvel_6776.t1-p1 / transcript=Cvel_6776.t1 / gene=Cvel_6776 / organism=Chromera_velia_CCMP2878 / gene_product=hypothetical protein / transcript_product=hypothetical protein / location=Cvel_scaffold340:46141-46437(-) / protein_length=99 / sequence_SO=supercontig / SO=protein_coding / is_pseudo=false